jgi:3-oxosteroid 1-dehydrogenase
MKTFDLVVLGAGAAGMTAALVAAEEGASVLLVERTAFVGGTSARSSGTLWIPRDTAAARQYLDALVGAKADHKLREAFLVAGPRMVDWLAERAGFRFRPYPHHPDYRQEIAGAALGERPLEPPEFDGRELGAGFEHVGWPIPELTLFNGMMVTRGEAARLLKGDAVLGARLLTRYLLDRVRHPRGTRLVLGNALVARLYKALLDRKVPVRFNAKTESLQRERGQLSIRISGETVAAKAVVLAGGGFPAGAAMREKHFRPPVATNTPAYEGCTGETIQLGLDAGGVLGPSGEDNALWFPGSVARRADGSTAVYPHIVLDRAKPGLVAVGRAGTRFTDEAVSYHEVARAMYRTGNVPCWLICDSRFLWKYGLGMVRPMTLFPKKGYLQRANSVEALAKAIDVNIEGLKETVGQHNKFASSGSDPEFGKGGNAYDVNNGDPENRPNPCLGPIERAPFYAVRVEPVPLGTSLGLLTNENAQVLDAQGAPISGLYAAGNDMHSVMGGEYPGAGAQLGPGMTFGFLAALHAVTREDIERRAA